MTSNSTQCIHTSKQPRDKNLQNRPFQLGNGRKNPEEEANSWLGLVRKYCTDEDQTKIGTYTELLGFRVVFFFDFEHPSNSD